jgi:glycerophosphoryl diester phosphodiesterase
MPAPTFDLQGHRGARGLKPENTWPAFEVAFDLGVTSVETDVHLTADGVPVLFHDAVLSSRLCRPLPGAPVLEGGGCPVRGLTLAQLRMFRADKNPDPGRFPDQDAGVTPLARLFADGLGLDPYSPPTLVGLFAFWAAYCGEKGRQAGKTAAQQARAGRVRFDLELKRVPFRPAVIGDNFAGAGPGELERLVVQEVRRAGLVRQAAVRSFDHRSVHGVRLLEPGLLTEVLVAGTAPLAPAELAWRAGAEVYCPDVEFLDEAQVKELHAAGVRVLPWTVNDPDDWRRLLDGGVDGITTDFPDRLAELLRQRGTGF